MVVAKLYLVKSNNVIDSITYLYSNRPTHVQSMYSRRRRNRFLSINCEDVNTEIRKRFLGSNLMTKCTKTVRIERNNHIVFDEVSYIEKWI